MHAHISLRNSCIQLIIRKPKCPIVQLINLEISFMEDYFTYSANQGMNTLPVPND